MCLVPTHPTRRFLLWDPKIHHKLLNLYIQIHLAKGWKHWVRAIWGVCEGKYCKRIFSSSSSKDQTQGLCTVHKCFTKKLHPSPAMQLRALYVHLIPVTSFASLAAQFWSGFTRESVGYWLEKYWKEDQSGYHIQCHKIRIIQVGFRKTKTPPPQTSYLSQGMFD